MILLNDMVLTREQYAKLRAVAKVTPAYLYEAQHAKDGSIFCYWERSAGHKIYIRVWPNHNLNRRTQ